MVTMADLTKREVLTPSEMKRLGNRVRYFLYEDYCKRYQGDEAKLRLQMDVKEAMEERPCLVYTGIHKEADWSRTFWWEKGLHCVNRTLDYAVFDWTK